MGPVSRQEQMAYQRKARRYIPNRPIAKNTVRAFLVGGGICVLGQAIQHAFVRFAHFTVKDAANPTVAVLILLSVIFTALGVYDKFAQWAGGGSAVPVTGFANTMASAAMEYRSEGWVNGVGGSMFKLAGAVIVFGVVSAFFVALVRYIIGHLAG
ncbi:stage V sporulation protein AC [Alicyclobacillus cellulosilyticus]|uniref:Stage V sporulation protein AC n=1 Tax=Alicyclobacillus cellulosilyticus TaxID=1003997 RepID=A0A917NEL7_9BACL|nr:stage V sporulation protein AC [Alicyclobacillus cellulosilyticus]GGI95580.1 stage V sporulation protein AC [Alicyclobacillus cellulosilyticus]